jgi:SAM-dependent methyltransferase
MTPAMRNEFQESVTCGFDPSLFERLMAVEDQHFWFVSRNRIIARLVQQLTTPLKPGYQVLEMGCGTGNTLRVLERVCRQGSVIGLDLFPEALHYARQRVSCQLILGDIHEVNFEQPFDLIGLFDVLEHLPDDREILLSLYRWLKPGGTLLLTVPAHPSLWSYFDQASHHCRRYRHRDLTRKLTDTGYQIDFSSLYMASIFPLVWLGRKLAKPLTPKPIAPDQGPDQALESLVANDLKIVPGVNDVLTWLLSQEAHWLANRWRLPMGTSLIAIARKPL